jgi:hypothetical protein
MRMVSASHFDARARYIDLLKRSVRGLPYFENELRILYLKGCLEGKWTYDAAALHDIWTHDRKEAVRRAAANDAGMPLDWRLENLGFQHTMLGQKRLDNIEECFQTIIADGIPGDLMECGVWRGGAIVLMRGLLEAYEEPDRVVWAADSFEGLPPPTMAPDVEFGLDLSRAQCPMLAVGLDQVKRTVDAYGLLDARVRFLEGWFKDTLGKARIARLALLRLDGDIYESTMDALGALYGKVAPGGFVIVDDLFVPTCRQAVNEFRAAHRIDEPIVMIDSFGGYWRKAGS